MSVIYYTFAVSDSTIASGSPFVVGLTPVIAALRTTGASPADVSTHAAITAVGGGIYQIAYDAEAFGEAAGVVDCSATVPTNSDRYLPITLARDSSRIQGAINAAGFANINLGQAGLIPRALDSIADSALTVGDAVICAIATAAGRQTISGTVYEIATPATGTRIRSLNLNDPTTPSSRT